MLGRGLHSFACALALVLCLQSSSHAATLTLKLGHGGDYQDLYAQGAVKFAELVEKKSDGAIKVKVFHDGQLGKQGELIECMISGTVDMAMVSLTFFARYLPDLLVFELPYLYRDMPHAYKALDTVAMEVAEQSQDWGVKTLALMENGLRHMSNSRRPFRVPADLRGLHMYVSEQSEYLQDMMWELDAYPVRQSLDDLRGALANGTVDGQESSLAQMCAGGLYEVQAFTSLTGHAYSAQPLLISMIAWKKMSPEQQNILREAAIEATDWQRALCRKMESVYVDCISSGGKSSLNADVDRKAFGEATSRVWQQYSSRQKDGRLLIKRILEIR